MNPEAPVHHFEADAMNTGFALRLRHADREAARAMAGACLRRLEELEDRLSRYRPSSEICQINALAAGESLLISEDTARCLRVALEMSRLTGGLFDPAIGAVTGDPAGPTPVCGRLSLDPERPRVTCEEAGRRIDLGAIGKGFALDEIGRLLEEFGPCPALLSSGASGHLAVGGWSSTIELRGCDGSLSVTLCEGALSSSGTVMQGAHVVDPATGRAPEYAFRSVWVTAPTAAEADALSTAAFLLDEEGLREAAGTFGGRYGFYYEKSGDSGVRRVTVES